MMLHYWEMHNYSKTPCIQRINENYSCNFQMVLSWIIQYWSGFVFSYHQVFIGAILTIQMKLQRRFPPLWLITIFCFSVSQRKASFFYFNLELCTNQLHLILIHFFSEPDASCACCTSWSSHSDVLIITATSLKNCVLHCECFIWNIFSMIPTSHLFKWEVYTMETTFIYSVLGNVGLYTFF